MGEVDQLDDAVHHRVAEGDERVHGAVSEAKDGDLDESGGVDDRLGRKQDYRRGRDKVEREVDHAHAAERQGADPLQS